MTESTTVGPGTVLAGRYELTAEIGRGGFGRVYQARQLNMDRDVAVKVLPPQFMSVRDVVERFKREAKLASRLRHPNTITLHDYGQHENSLFIVMELLTGEDLADLLKREGRLPPKRIIQISRQVLKSLAEAHEHKIVHRDLKPENIFLSVVGDETDHVKVLDFGIAKMALPGLEEHPSAGDARKLTLSGSTVGTPTYMSPEQAAGEQVNGQTDLYALGVIMYEMASGRPPFYDNDAVKVMRQHLFEPVPPFRDSNLKHTVLERVIKKALEKEKDRRFKDANEFLLALAGEPVARPVIQGLNFSALKEPSTMEFDPDSDARRSDVRPAASDYEFEDDPQTDRQEGDSFPNTLGYVPAISPDSEANQSSHEQDAIPFGAVDAGSEEREKATVRSGVTSTSSLSTDTGVSEPPPGFMLDASGPSGSSILTVIEPPTDDEDDVILLTKKKTNGQKPNGQRENEQGEGETGSDETREPDDVEVADAANSAELVRSPADSHERVAAQTPQMHVDERSGEWVWGQPDPADASDADIELERSGGAARLLFWLFLVLAAVVVVIVFGDDIAQNLP